MSTDVRLISASNRDLAKAVSDGRFREDLFYRLSVVQIQIPPLRERVEDIPLLAKYFVEKYSAQFKRRVTKISPEAELLLRNYAWPGNVRELRNAMERAVLLGNGETITADNLSGEIALGPIKKDEEPLFLEMPESGLSLSNLESQLVKQALELAQGNQVRAARLLGISRDAFRNRLKKFGLL